MHGFTFFFLFFFLPHNFLSRVLLCPEKAVWRPGGKYERCGLVALKGLIMCACVSLEALTWRVFAQPECLPSLQTQTFLGGERVATESLLKHVDCFKPLSFARCSIENVARFLRSILIQGKTKKKYIVIFIFYRCSRGCSST